MTDTIETLRRLHAEALGGPWRTASADEPGDWIAEPDGGGDCSWWCIRNGDQTLAIAVMDAEHPKAMSEAEYHANAALIVAMHAALPKLLACVEALEPFARSSERDWDDDAPDDTEVWSSQGSGWPTSKSCFDVGDLRRAARALASLKEPAQ